MIITLYLLVGRIQYYKKEWGFLYTIQSIARILDAPLYDAQGKEHQPIDDFEYQMLHVKSQRTAFISISEASWKNYLNKSKVMKEGNDQIPRDVTEIGLIITENYVDDLEQSIPQIVVGNAIKAMKTLALYIRKHYTNPVIALTGSMGKSSTRLMLAAALQPLNVQQNRGNANTRSAIYLHMCKLAANPDIAIFETSLNAINNRGNMSKVLKPQIAIVTGIGSAHLSTIGSTEDIAEFKSRIYAGLSSDGVAIYNGDTLHHEHLKEVALKYTQKVYGYSTKDKKADLYAEEIRPVKKAVQVTTSDKDTFIVPSVSLGMVENALAVLLTLKHLNVDVTQSLKNLSQTQLFKKVLEFKTVRSENEAATVLDDTHNASLPAMLNAIEAFDSQTPFFTGHKIIALGQISDLGDQAQKVHEKLIPALEKSNADYILCMDQPLRRVVEKVKGKHITWYKDQTLLLQDLCYLVNEDALVLMKSSVTKTEFPKVAAQLPHALLHYQRSGEEAAHFQEAAKQGKAYMIYNLDNQTIEKQWHRANSQTIEGLAPLLYYIDAKRQNLSKDHVTLKKWPTNHEKMQEGDVLVWDSLVESMRQSPHPSLVYQLAHELYRNHKERKNNIEDKINTLHLSKTSAVNLTGRFRIKERQNFSIDDLLKIICKFKKYLLFENEDLFVIGKIRKHGYMKRGSKIIIFTGMENIEEVYNLI